MHFPGGGMDIVPTSWAKLEASPTTDTVMPRFIKQAGIVEHVSRLQAIEAAGLPTLQELGLYELSSEESSEGTV